MGPRLAGDWKRAARALYRYAPSGRRWRLPAPPCIFGERVTPQRAFASGVAQLPVESHGITHGSHPRSTPSAQLTRSVEPARHATMMGTRALVMSAETVGQVTTLRRRTRRLFTVPSARRRVNPYSVFVDVRAVLNKLRLARRGRRRVCVDY